MKTLIGCVVAVADAIAVKALMIAQHAPHAGNKVAAFAVGLMIANLVVFGLLLRGKSKPKATPPQRRPGGYGGSPFGGPR